MPFCVACGAEHPASARFCPACGREIGAAARAGGPPATSRKIVTVLFADIVGSTSLGEHHDPETVQALLADYFAQATAIMRRHGGTIEKFIGDAVVAVFGVPTAHEDDALRAVRAAVEFRTALREHPPTADGRPLPLQVCIGVNTGEVVVGDPSTAQSFSVGDPMNVTARLQQAATADQILIGDLTYQLVQDAVEVEPAGELALKGRDEHVTAWSVLDLAASPRPRPEGAPLVGRTAELGVLRDALAAAVQAGACRLVTVLGDAGVGKSKLTSSFADDAGVPVLYGRCLSYGDGTTFWPLVDVVRTAAGAETTDVEELRRKLGAVLPADEDREQLIPRLLEIVQGGGTASAQELFWAVRRFLETLCSTSPRVLIVDDIHWAEPTFLDLLEYLVTWMRWPLLLLCQARPELRENRPSWSRGAASEVIELAPLASEDVTALIEALAGPLPRDLASRVVAAAEGNALYVEEMLRMFRDDEAAARSQADLVVPPSVQALIAARLDRLDAPGRSLLQRASVIGIEFSAAELAAISDDAAPAVDGSLLQMLVRRQFVVGHPEASEESYRFGHGLIREVAYAGTPKRERARLHAQFATWLQDRKGDHVGDHDEIIGHHLAQAVTLRIDLGLHGAETDALADGARELLGSAGRRALTRSDLPAAAKLLRRAAQLAAQHPGVAVELQLELCDALLDMGDLAEAQDVVATVLATTAALGDERLTARARVMQAWLDFNLGTELDRDEVAREFEQVLRTLDVAGDLVGSSQAHQVLADVNWNDSRFEAAQKDLEQALEFADRAGNARERGRVVVWLASALLWGPAHVHDATRRCEEILRQFAGDLLVEAKTLMILAGLYAMRGDFAAGREAFARSRQVHEDLGMSLSLASGSHVAGMIELLAGDVAGAEREFRLGYDALTQMGQKGYLAAAATFLARTLLTQGRLDEAEALADEVRTLAGEDDPSAQGDYASIAARLSAARGDHVEAVALARAAVASYAGTDEVMSHADALRDLAEALASAGRGAEARAAAEEALRLYELKGVTPAVGAAQALVDSLDSGSA